MPKIFEDELIKCFRTDCHILQDSPTRSICRRNSTTHCLKQGMADFVSWAVGILRRQYLVILFVAALGLVAGLIYLSVATPIYTAQTNVYIDLHKNPLDQQPGVFGNDPIEIESQIQIIKSKAVAYSVVKKLQLLDNSEFRIRQKKHFRFFCVPIWRDRQVTAESDPLEEMIAAFRKQPNCRSRRRQSSCDQIQFYEPRSGCANRQCDCQRLHHRPTGSEISSQSNCDQLAARTPTTTSRTGRRSSTGRRIIQKTKQHCHY